MNTGQSPGKKGGWRAAALCLLLLAACNPSSPWLDGFNVILINVDTLRSDHLGCYGYQRPTSPFIDKLASSGVLFEESRSNSSFTRESVAVLMTGQLPGISGSTGWNAHPAPNSPTLPELFRAAGYRTGFFTTSTMLTHAQFTRGFDEVVHRETLWGVSRTGRQLSQQALDFVRQHGAERLFLYVHYLDPHGPYDPPEDLYQRFGIDPKAPRVDVYQDVRPSFERLLSEGFGPGDRRFQDMVRRYDAEIADTDRAIEALIGGITNLGLGDRTLVIITADHGEEFLEHGFIEHAWTLYEESVRVPLIFWAPQKLAPQRVRGAVSSLDVLPAILALVRIPHALLALTGTALFGDTDSKLQARAASQPYVGELLIGERNAVRAVVRGCWKYTAAHIWLEPKQRPAAAQAQNQPSQNTGARPVTAQAPIVREELYNLCTGGADHDDQSSRAVPELAALRKVLADHLDLVRRHEAGRPSEPSTTAGIDDADRERLRALGYVD